MNPPFDFARSTAPALMHRRSRTPITGNGSESRKRLKPSYLDFARSTAPALMHRRSRTPITGNGSESRKRLKPSYLDFARSTAPALMHRRSPLPLYPLVEGGAAKSTGPCNRSHLRGGPKTLSILRLRRRGNVYWPWAAFHNPIIRPSG